jgi:hypothetical protein
MGYTTKFEGTLKFAHTPTVEQIAALNEILGGDPDDHKQLREFYVRGESYSYLQYEVTRDMTGIKWDGGEKFYYAEHALNLILRYMRSKWPEFDLTGSLSAQGEEVGDVWQLVVKNGIAKRVDTPPAGEKIKCPHCDEEFYYEAA